MPKLLLVEDDNNLREIYEARLQAEGYAIVSAKDGEEALVVAKAEKPDLIISDVMMPKISGFEMLDILRNTPELRDTKVIMLTALGQAEDQSRANRLGADRYLVKSQVTLEDIVKVAHELLGDNVGEVVTPDPQSTTPVTNVSVADPPTPAPDPSLAAPAEPIVPAPAAPAPEPIPAPAAAPPVEPSAVPMPENITVPPPADNSAAKQTEISIDATGQLSQTEAQESAVMDQQINDFLKTAGSAADAPATQAAPAPDPDQAANDQTLTQAVNDLMDSNASSVNDSQDQTASVPTEPADPPATDDGSSVTVNGKKIIKPLNEPQSSSLDELVAKEEMKDMAGSQDKPSTSPFDPNDPNNIAI